MSENASILKLLDKAWALKKCFNLNKYAKPKCIHNLMFKFIEFWLLLKLVQCIYSFFIQSPKIYYTSLFHTKET